MRGGDGLRLSRLAPSVIVGVPKRGSVKKQCEDRVEDASLDDGVDAATSQAALVATRAGRGHAEQIKPVGHMS